MPEIMAPIIQKNGACAKEHLPLIPEKDLIKLTKLIIFNRIFEEKMMTLQRQGRLGFAITSIGEEAITLGAAYALHPNDPIFLTYRELGALLWRNVPLESIVNQLMGNEHDFNKGRQMPVHYCFREQNFPSVSSPVGTQLTHACGYAHAAKFKKTGQVALGFLGEGTASGNDFHSALNFAGVFNVPAIFLIRNNHYAISTPENLQTAGDLISRGKGYGVYSVQIDGNDLLCVVKAVREAAERARNGEGPTLIEAKTYRLGAHSSSDDPSLYVPEKEKKEHEAEGDLKRLIKHMKWRKLWTDKIQKDTEAKADQDISKLIEKCEKWPRPRIETMFEDVYETMPNHLREQQTDYLAHLHRLDKRETL